MVTVTESNVSLYMRYEKVLPSAQGMAIYGDLAFILHHTGVCAVYDLAARQSAPLTSFKLASYNDGADGKERINHSNQCMFGSVHIGANPLPLLYVTTGNDGGADEAGYYYRCAVENITLHRGADGIVTGGKSELVQTISLNDKGIENSRWQRPCWGCPAWFVDPDTGVIYTFSARYRTTAAFKEHYADNNYIITKYRSVNPLNGGAVMLTSDDITDQFECPFDIPFTQGGMIHGGRLYYTFGCGSANGGEYPDGLRVYDLREKRLVAKANLQNSVLGAEEIESCSFYNGELLCNTNADIGGIYSLGRIWRTERES